MNNQRIDKLSQHVQEQRSAHSTEVQQLRTKLEDVQVGGLGLATMGWWWFLLGSSMSTLSTDLSR